MYLVHSDRACSLFDAETTYVSSIAAVIYAKESNKV